MVPLKYLSNFWRTLEMPLINWEVELILSLFCKLCYNLYRCCKSTSYIYNKRDKSLCPFSLSTQDNAKLLPQLKSGFKRTIRWNKYLAKPELLPQNANLNHLIEPSFQRKAF